MATNPIARPMTALVEKSVAAAAHLRGKEADQYKAAVALAKLLAGQIDDASVGGDPDQWNKINMRVVPNFLRVLYTLGLTPEGYAKITNPQAVGRSPGRPPKDGPDEPAAEASAPKAEAGDALDEIMAKVVSMKDRR